MATRSTSVGKSATDAVVRSGRRPSRQQKCRPRVRKPDLRARSRRHGQLAPRDCARVDDPGSVASSLPWLRGSRAVVLAPPADPHGDIYRASLEGLFVNLTASPGRYITESQPSVSARGPRRYRPNPRA